VDTIPVGNGPDGIGVDNERNTVYVSNFGDGTVSVIDIDANKVVSRVMFNVEPFNSGHIECYKEKLLAPQGQQFYIYVGSECTAKPNPGFEFVSWEQNLDGNSSQLIKVASSPSFLDTVLDFFHIKPDKPEATLNITKFGSFTANFRTLPPPIPGEYLATLFTVIVTAFVGSWLTPTVIQWRKARKQGKKLDHYHSEIKLLRIDGKLDTNDIEKLDSLRNNITDEYTRGKINKEQFDKLEKDITIRYNEIFTTEINSIDVMTGVDKVKHLDEIMKGIEDANDKGKINKEQYTDLKKKVSIQYKEILDKRIESLYNLAEKDKGKQLEKIKDDVSGAYSKENVTELHYALLKEKLVNLEKK
jgi:YVTN family beta-propeller protein